MFRSARSFVVSGGLPLLVIFCSPVQLNASPPRITALSPTSGAVGASVKITGSNFGSTQGASTVSFNTTKASPTNWSATSIVAPVPAGATSGKVVVTVGGKPSNGVSFTVVQTPSITSLTPISGVVGASVTITGTNFGSTQGASAVFFNATKASPTSWSATSIVAPVPAGATTGNVVVTVSGVASAGVLFTVLAVPSISSLSPSSGAVGASVTIAGGNFGSTQGTSAVTFNGTVATPASWSATSIVAPVPAGATTGNVVVTVSGVASAGFNFTATVPDGNFVQGNNATGETPQTTATVTYTAPQVAGDLNIVVVGWNDSTARVQSVTDTVGNAYSLAIGPTVQSGVATQAIYYAKKIAPAAANGNTVTVTFTVPATSADIRIAEYSGLDTANPLDASSAAQGNGTLSDSGSVTTTNGNDLLVAANQVQTGSSGAGTGYTTLVITSPDADILEDQLVTAIGSYSATAPVSPSGQWIMQMVAFRMAGSGGGTASQLSVSPASNSFGSVQVGNSAIQSETLTNSGDSDVMVTQVTVSGSGFAVSGLNPSLTLTPGQSFTFDIVFAPTFTGTSSASISVISDASNSPITIFLSGTGIAAGQLNLTPTTLNFGSVVVGASASLTGTLSATGSSVTVSSATVGTSEFTLSGLSFPFVLATGQSAPFTVIFRPQSSGTASDNLTFVSNAMNSSLAESLTGSGTAPPQHGVDVSWRPSASVVIGYNVYRSITSGGPYTKINLALNGATTYTDNTVQEGQTYYYVATAVDSSGTESKYSNESATVIPSP